MARPYAFVVYTRKGEFLFLTRDEDEAANREDMDGTYEGLYKHLDRPKEEAYEAGKKRGFGEAIASVREMRENLDEDSPAYRSVGLILDTLEIAKETYYGA